MATAMTMIGSCSWKAERCRGTLLSSGPTLESCYASACQLGRSDRKLRVTMYYYMQYSAFDLDLSGESLVGTAKVLMRYSRN